MSSDSSTSALEGHTQQLLDSAPDAIIVIDSDGLILFVNEQAERLFGYSRSELLEQTVEVLVPDRIKHSHPRHRAKYFAHPTTRPMGAGLDLTAQRKDGTEFPVDISLSTLHTESGMIVSAAVRDISDRREAEVAQARLAAIVQASQDAIIGKTTKGIVTSWNPAAASLFGWSGEEVIGRHIRFLFPDDRRTEEEQILTNLARGERIDSYETERMTNSGGRVVVSLMASPILNAADDVVGIASIYRDRTTLKKAEAKFQGLLEAAPDAIVGVGPDGLIQLVNAQAESLFGYPRAELVGRPVEILVPAEVKSIHPGHRTGYFAHPTTRSMGEGLDLTARRKDGSEFPVDISLSSLDTEAGVIVSAAVRDVSERIRAAKEKERLQVQLKQSRLESIGQLAGGIAHDFNNLLAGIMSYTKLVQQGIQQRLKDDRTDSDSNLILHDANKIAETTERAAALTHQLLLFGRKEVVKPRLLNLNGIVTGMEDLLHRTIGEHILLTTELSHPLKSINMDPGHVDQILMNLVVNARDAMSSGGRLSIRTTEAELDKEYALLHGIRPDRYVCLSVSDTGTGMPREVASKAFEPFFSTKPAGEGSGLGLATVYGIVTQSKGHVAIYSELGIGTALKVYFPAVESLTELPEEEVDVPMGVVKGESILLVEDEEIVREPTARFLDSHGYRVLVAADPAEAWEISVRSEEKIDLLLTDVVMPNMSGKELADKMVASRHDLQVIFMSGYTQDMIDAQGAGSSELVLIEKPFSSEVLLKTVRQVLDKAAAIHR